MPADVASASLPTAPDRLAGSGSGTAWLFVSFFAVPFFLFNVLPTLFGFYISFTEWAITGQPVWVGLENYARAFQDVRVLTALKNTAFYAALIVPGVTIGGYLAALYVHQEWPLSTLARLFFFMPHVVAATVVALVWVGLLDTQLGPINHALAYVGIGPVPWLTNGDWTKVSVSLASIWWDFGLAFILFLAALQDVPKELIEAAELDGASPVRRLWHIVLPYTRPVISMVVVLQLIATMRIFSLVYLMTDGKPAGGSSSLVHVMFKQGIQRSDWGYASAIAMLLFALILLLSLIVRRLVRDDR